MFKITEGKNQLQIIDFSSCSKIGSNEKLSRKNDNQNLANKLYRSINSHEFKK